MSGRRPPPVPAQPNPHRLPPRPRATQSRTGWPHGHHLAPPCLACQQLQALTEALQAQVAALTQGTRGEKGDRWCERIWTTIATCAQQGRSVFEYLHACVVSHFDGRATPSLAPAGV